MKIEVTRLDEVKWGQLLALASVRLPELGIHVHGIEIRKQPRGSQVYARMPLHMGADGQLYPVVTFYGSHPDRPIKRAVLDAYEGRTPLLRCEGSTNYRAG